MRKIVLTFALLSVVFLSGCFGDAASIGIIGGSDGPTAIYLDDDFYESTEKEPVKAVRVNGELYFETGEDRDMPIAKVELDGTLTKGADFYEVPKQDNEANFNASGYVLGKLENTIEIPEGDDWEIFRKIEAPEVDVTAFKYIMKLEGKNEEYTVLSNSMDITVGDVAGVLEGTAENADIYVVAIDFD